MNVVIVALVAMALVACERKASAPSAEAAVAAPVLAVTAPKPPPREVIITAKDWARAVTASYDESGTKDEGDGITSFMACFPPVAQKCLIAFGKRDAFRKLRLFTPSGTQLSQVTAEHAVLSYVSIQDCGKPNLMLNPYFFSKTGWLFMNRVAVLVDGELAIDRDLSPFRPARTSYSWGIEESVHLSATAEEIQTLRRITDKSKVLVRLTGDKGYMPLNKDEVNVFRFGVQNNLVIYDALLAAVKDEIPKECR